MKRIVDRMRSGRRHLGGPDIFNDWSGAMTEDYLENTPFIAMKIRKSPGNSSHFYVVFLVWGGPLAPTSACSCVFGSITTSMEFSTVVAVSNPVASKICSDVVAISFIVVYSSPAMTTLSTKVCYIDIEESSKNVVVRIPKPHHLESPSSKRHVLLGCWNSCRRWSHDEVVTLLKQTCDD